MGMHLVVLAVPGCPNAPVLEERLAAVLGGRAGVSLSHQVISDEREAARWGMCGSPTLLINGADPFAEPAQPPGMSCRLYRGDDGQASGAPSAGQLQQVIEQALATSAEPTGGVWLDALRRGGRAGPRLPNVACGRCTRPCCDRSSPAASWARTAPCR
jgi:hypothetical protein